MNDETLDREQRDRKPADHLELGHDVVHQAVRAVGTRVEEYKDTFAAVDQLAKGGPVIARHRSVWWDIGELVDTGGSECRGPDVREREALGVRENEGNDLVRVSGQPSSNRCEISYVGNGISMYSPSIQASTYPGRFRHRKAATLSSSVARSRIGSARKRTQPTSNQPLYRRMSEDLDTHSYGRSG